MPQRLPSWLRRSLAPGGTCRETTAVLRQHRLSTVCEEARCPNRHECFSRRVATFMILGDRCTRACAFCGTCRAEGTLPPPDPDEPGRLAAAAAELGLQHVVVTSVTRDDLVDGGAAHFAATVAALRTRLGTSVTVEVLTPDFQVDPAALAVVVAAAPTVFNHNLETVERLQPLIRPQAGYTRSLSVLAQVRALSPTLVVKSGLMVGLGETDAEIHATLYDLRRQGVDLVTIGQYLQPRPHCLPVQRFVPPEEFRQYREWGREIGFQGVAAAPYVRSSYRAGENLAPAGRLMHGSAGSEETGLSAPPAT